MNGIALQLVLIAVAVARDAVGPVVRA